MKKDSMILIGAAGVALYLVMRAGSVKAAVTKVQQGATEIFNSLGKPFSNGYRYFSDGTVIDPAGAYWKNNQMIWAPPASKSQMSTTTDQALGDWTSEA